MPLTSDRSTAEVPQHNLDSNERQLLSSLIRRGFVLRLAVVLFLFWTGYSRQLAPDEETYFSDGLGLEMYWSGQAFAKPLRLMTDTPTGYFYMNAVSTYLFDGSDLPLRILNALVGAYCCRYAYLIARETFGKAVARRTASLYVYFPSLILWSSLNIRDIWVIALLLIIAWNGIRVSRAYSHTGLAVMLGAIYALTYFRDYLFYVVAIPPVFGFLVGRRGHFGRNFLVTLVASIALLYLVDEGAGRRAAEHLDLETLSQTRRSLASGGSAFGENVDISTPARALAFLPIGLSYFMFSPFPWQMTSALKLLSLPEMIIIYFFTPAIFRGIRYAVRRRFRECAQILLLTALITASYALGEGNVGTLYRHRAQALTFYLMFAATGIELKRRQAPNIAALSPEQLRSRADEFATER